MILYIMKIIHSCINQRTKSIDQIVALSRSGTCMWRKACHILQSSGITPNNNNTWQLLKAKHPSCPTPVTSAAASLEPDFNVISTLCSFPKDSAADPQSSYHGYLGVTTLGWSHFYCPQQNQGVQITMGETMRRLTGKCNPVAGSRYHVW